MMIPLALLLLLTGLTGCKTLVLHPITQQDIAVMKKGIPYTPDRDGYFLSKVYVDEVMQAKVDRINLK